MNVEKINEILQRHFGLRPRSSLIEKLNELGILLANGDNHSRQMAVVLSHVGMPIIDEPAEQRLLFKIVVESWHHGTLAAFDIPVARDRARKYLQAMPWLVRPVAEEEESSGVTAEIITQAVAAARVAAPVASWKAIAEKVAADLNCEFWTVYPKALALKKATKELPVAAPVAAAPVAGENAARAQELVDNYTKRGKKRK